MTPRQPVKRRLVFTTPQVKRARFTQAKRFNFNNKRIIGGPSKKGNLVSQVRSLQRVVQSFLPELKNTTVDLAQANFGTAGTIQHITAVAQGNAENQRIGEDMTLKKLFIKGQITNMKTTSTTSVPVYYRFLVVRDKQQVNDTVPAIGDVVSATDPVTAMPVVGFANRFQYVYVSPLICNNSTLLGNQMGVVDHSWSGTVRVGFNGSNATDIQKNGFYFLILTSDDAGTVDFTGTCRVVFTDT